MDTNPASGRTNRPCRLQRRCPLPQEPRSSAESNGQTGNAAEQITILPFAAAVGTCQSKQPLVREPSSGSQRQGFSQPYLLMRGREAATPWTTQQRPHDDTMHHSRSRLSSALARQTGSRAKSTSRSQPQNVWVSTSEVAKMLLESAKRDRPPSRSAARH